MESPKCHSPLEEPQDRSGIPWSWGSAVQEARKDLEHSTSQHPEEPTEHPPSPAATAESSTRNREIRGVLGNGFIPISTNCRSPIPGLIIRRENSHHGPSLISLPIKRELRQGFRILEGQGVARKSQSFLPEPVWAQIINPHPTHSWGKRLALIFQVLGSGLSQGNAQHPGNAALRNLLAVFLIKTGSIPQQLCSMLCPSPSTTELQVRAQPWPHILQQALEVFSAIREWCRSPPGTPMPVCPRDRTAPVPAQVRANLKQAKSSLQAETSALPSTSWLL